MDGSSEDTGHTVKLAGHVMVGGLLQQLSVTVTVNQHELVLPQSSVAVYTTRVLPMPNSDPGA